MGMHEGRAAVGKAMKDLLLKWNDTKSQWNDSNARTFESKHLTGLEMDARQAVQAMDHMIQVIQMVKRDCG